MTSTANFAIRVALLLHQTLSAPSAWAEFVERCRDGIRAPCRVGLSVRSFATPGSNYRVFRASIPRESIVVNVPF
jgi:hypothetical protein